MDRHTSSVRTRMAALVDATWAFSALTAAVELDVLGSFDSSATAAELARRTGLSELLITAVLDVLASVGVVGRQDGCYTPAPELEQFRDTSAREDLLAWLRSTHLQSRTMVDAARRGTLCPGWTHTDPELLQAQGRTGRASVHGLASQLFPRLPGLQERLASAGARFLDVGMGVGVVSIELCRLYPHLRVVGLEPGQAPAQEALRNIAAAGLADRIEIRSQRLQDLSDRDAYDFVYLPQVFMPVEVVKLGLPRVREALRPGGWLAMVAFDAPGDDLHASTARLLNVLWGGTPLDIQDLARCVHEAGFEMVQTGGEPGSSIKGILGRRPARAAGGGESG